jgi:hypothetical protein
MGKVTGAALAAAAPEAAAARRVASAAGGSRGKGGRPPVADPRVAAPGSEAARQRQAIEEIKARRPAAPGHPMIPAASSSSAPAAPSPASPGGGPSLPSVSVPGSVQTGSGFLLGVFAWAVGLAYLRGGTPEVRKFFAAKFLNKA